MSRDMVYEEVPRLSRRLGDTVLAGGNNATILLGRDRIESVDSGYGSAGGPGGGKGAGAIHMLVGRRGEDPTPGVDRATFYLSAKTDPDAVAGTAGIGSTDSQVSAVVSRADCIRVAARRNIIMAVGSSIIEMDSFGVITVDGTRINLGRSAASPTVMAAPYRSAEDLMLSLIATALAALAGHPVISAAIPVATAVTAAANGVATFISGAPSYLTQVTLVR